MSKGGGCDSNGNKQYSFSNIMKIVFNNNPEKEEVYKLLVKHTEKDKKEGKCRFNKTAITAILKFLNKNNIDIAKKLISNTTWNEQEGYRFSGESIADILADVSSDNKKHVKELINHNETDKFGYYRFDSHDIRQFMLDFDPRNADLLLDVIKCTKKNEFGDYLFNGDTLHYIQMNLFVKNKERVQELVSLYKDGKISEELFNILLEPEAIVTVDDYKEAERKIGKDKIINYSESDLLNVCLFQCLIDKKSLNEVPVLQKKQLLRNLLKSEEFALDLDKDAQKHLPLFPFSKEQYCDLLTSLVKSIGIETNKLSNEEIENAYKSLNSLSQKLSLMNIEDIKSLSIKQEYSQSDFISSVNKHLMGLPEAEIHKIYDYFGFEIKKTVNSYKITGYPVNSAEEYSDIKNPKTRETIEKLRPVIVKYTQNNQILCNNIEIGELLNNILNAFPELRVNIDGKNQVLEHILILMSNITKNHEYEKLNEQDKKIILLSALFGNINKMPAESAFDANYILKKLHLTREEQVKIYSLIKNQDRYINLKKFKGEKQIKEMQSIAFDMQYDNLFEMSKILITADKTKMPEDFNEICEKIESNIYELKKTQPLLPVTKLPSASRIKEAVTKVNKDGSTDIKGVYIIDGITVIKYNEVENETWEKIGFPIGSISKGIKCKNGKVNTGNIKFFVHGLDKPENLERFEIFELPDSDALLSVSYAERPESKYRFFRSFGVILNTDAKYVYGGGIYDYGSGTKKDIDTFKEDYVFGGVREEQRTCISNMIKKALNLSDDEYIQFVKENKNKPFTQIQPESVRNKIIQQFASINSNIRFGEREYNEMYISNPEVMGVFAYAPSNKVGYINEFIDNQQDFIKDYAKENDLPFMVFGD